MQPSFGNYLPVALFVGLVAALLVYASSAFGATYPWAGAVWIIFISWALYFMAGAKASRIHKYVLGLVGGVFAGWLTLALVSFTSGIVGATLGLPVTVFFIASAIILLELTDWFELAPAYFFAYAAYFAFVFGGFGGEATNAMQAVYVSIMLMVGIFVGWIVAVARAMIFDFERVPLEHRGTVFDKEIR